MNKTIRAVRAAFNRDMFPTLGNIYTTSEPEAAATAIIQDMIARKTNSLYAVCQLTLQMIDTDEPCRANALLWQTLAGVPLI